MLVPGRWGHRGGPDPLGDPPGEAAEDPQRESLPRGAVGAVGEVPSAEVNGVLTGGVAVEDLKDEQVDRGDRVENPVAPGVLFLQACVPDGIG